MKHSNKQQVPQRQKPFGQVLFSHHGIPAVPRLVGYARVSTIEQSMDMQVTKLIEAGVDKDADLFADKLSATNARRPCFAAMLKHIQRHDTLLVYSVSRLFRDAEKLLTFFKEMKARGIEIKSLTEPLDLKTSQGRMIATIQAAVDQHEREKIRDRTVDGMAERMRQGQMMGRPQKLTAAQIDRMKLDRKFMNPKQLAAKYAVSIATVNKYAPLGATA